MATSTNGLPNLVSIPSGYQPLNSEGLALANLASWHLQRIGNTGILAAPPEPGTMQPVGSMPNPAATQRRVWLDEPPGSIPFDEQGSIFLPPAVLGVDVTVVSALVPQGYDGVVNYISNNIASANMPSVSGDLVWKILVNGRPVRNFGNITQEKGTIAQGRRISPIRLFSGDRISYVVQQALGSTLVGETICSLNGYFYPSKGVS